MSTTETTPSTEEQAGALAERLFGQTLGALEMLTVYLGLRLGLYGTLQKQGPSTPAEVAAAAGIDTRYAREWLEQQAAAGLVEVDDVAAPEDARRYALPEAHVPVLLDPDSLFNLAGAGIFMGSAAKVLPQLLDAYRSGAGIPLAEYGDDFVEGQSLFNRPQFTQLLAGDWLAAVPDVRERLEAKGARVADVACGTGWSSIALARAFPDLTVDGIDLDEASIAVARKNAAEAGVADRVTFEVRDAADPQLAGAYDAVFIFEAVHDMSQPANVLRAVRGLRAPSGTVIVMDEKVEETFTAPANEIERFLYSASVLHCLPVGRADQPSVGTGTVLRPATMRRYATEAGFADVEILPIEHDIFRFYRLEG
jgi:2-polyprenyl-3-methyl-5-hydroxy-6-metoxy-1,4-benzoquinol methylase